jgi:hypothetical protein
MPSIYFYEQTAAKEGHVKFNAYSDDTFLEGDTEDGRALCGPSSGAA